MDRLQVRLLNRGQARRAFLADNAADFPEASPGGRVASALDAEIAAILADAARQSSGAVSRNVDVKDEDFFELKKIMRQMNRAGNSLGEEFEGIEELFRLPRTAAEEIWLAKGRAFYADSAAHETAMSEYIEDDDFRANLMAVITRMEASSTNIDIAEHERGGATGSLKAHFRELGRLGRKAHNIVLNKYEDDPEKLAAWTIASHLKAAPKSKEEGEGENPQT